MPWLELRRAGRKEAVRRALEEEKRRTRFEPRMRGEQLAVPRLKRAQMLALLARELLEHPFAARIGGDIQRPCVEVEAALFGGDRHPQRVARE